ncbi:hypothetical protein RN001_014601 [Aquatica leii]|uniref:Uncharacterized protein n=1 Tax=Aquatica leii TaxID=1421715 RepID=A0AAN7PPJ6_9COLE|nr:hypothetical protein RN001_014601 [Aquatica leii]
MEVKQPPYLEINNADNKSSTWKRWISKFEIYINTLTLLNKIEDKDLPALQLNLFMNCVGDEGIDIINELTVEQKKDYACPIQRNNKEQNRQYNKYGYDQNKYGHSSRQLTPGRGKFENGNADRVAPIQNRRKEIQCDNLLTEEEAQQEEEFVEELQINQIKEKQRLSKGWYKEIQIKIYDDYDLTNVNNNPPVTNNENANNSSCSESSRPKRNVKQPAYLSDYI